MHGYRDIASIGLLFTSIAFALLTGFGLQAAGVRPAAVTRPSALVPGAKLAVMPRSGRNLLVAAPPANRCLNVPVLFYHHVEPMAQAHDEGHPQFTVDAGVFDAQMAYLVKAGYTSVSAEDLVNALTNGSSLPPKPVVVTLDDGYDDMYSSAFPIAQKYHIILNLMIPTGLLGNTDYLTWDQLQTMVQSGLVKAYDHTWSHASLGSAAEAKIKFEVMTAKTQLEQHLGTAVDLFTYPYGSEGQNVVSFLRQNGFRAAFSTHPGTMQCTTNLLNLPRTRVGNAPLSHYGL